MQNATCWCCSKPQKYSKAVGKHLLSETSPMKNNILFVFIFEVVFLSMIIFIFEIVLIFRVVLIFRLSLLLELFSFLGLYSFWGHLPHLGTIKFWDCLHFWGAAAPKNGVKFCQGTFGVIKSILATLYNVWWCCWIEVKETQIHRQKSWHYDNSCALCIHSLMFENPRFQKNIWTCLQIQVGYLNLNSDIFKNEITPWNIQKIGHFIQDMKIFK